MQKTLFALALLAALSGCGEQSYPSGETSYPSHVIADRDYAERNALVRDLFASSEEMTCGHLQDGRRFWVLDRTLPTSEGLVVERSGDFHEDQWAVYCRR